MQGFLQQDIVSAEEGGADTLLERPAKKQRVLLLMDDEASIVSSLKRLLRGDGYVILTAHSGPEGLALLESHPVDVIVSDQRMPGMTGVEFLSIAKTRYPDTIRIVLSGYTELQSVTDAVNEGAVYKFLTKPWSDDRLRAHLREAFERHELAAENRWLPEKVQDANRELAAANWQLAALLVERQQQNAHDVHMLAILREVLQQVALPVLAIDDCNMVAYINDAAAVLLQGRGPLLGADAPRIVPEIMQRSEGSNVGAWEVDIKDQRFSVVMHYMGVGSQSHGCLITLMPIGVAPGYP
jgi:CheY-like chemotaxis protein